MTWWAHGGISKIFIFRPEVLKFHPYSILTGDTRNEFVIYCVLRVAAQNICQTTESLSDKENLSNFTFLIIFKMMEIYTIFWNMYNWKSAKNCNKISRLQNMNKLKLWPYSFTEHNIAILYPIKLCFKKQFWKYDSRPKIFYIRGLKYEKCNSVVHL